MSKLRDLGSIALIGGGVALALVLLRPVPKAAPGTGTLVDPSVAARLMADAKNQKPATPANAGTGLTLTGSVLSGAEASLSVRMPSKVTDVLVKEGDLVRKGQMLARFDNREGQTQSDAARAGYEAALAQLRKAKAGRSAQLTKADADIRTAQAGLRQAQNRLQQATVARDAIRSDSQLDKQSAQENVRKAQAALEHAQQELASLEGLAKVGGVSKNDLEAARTQVRITQSDLASAKNQAAKAEAGSKSDSAYRVELAQKDVEAAQSAVTQAEEGVQTAKRARQQTDELARQDVDAAAAVAAQSKAGVSGADLSQSMTRLTSPIDGMVTVLSLREGEVAQPGQPIMVVQSLTDLRVEALVPARSVSKLHIGQPAQARLEAQPDKALALVVSEIAKSAEPDGRSFKVKFRFRDKVAVRPNQIVTVSLAASP